MSDEEEEYSEEDEPPPPKKPEPPKQSAPPPEAQSEAELAMEEKIRKKREEEEQAWNEYLEQRKKIKAKEEEELKKLKERQSNRKTKRAEQEQKLEVFRKRQEATRIKELEERKRREAEAKRKRLEEAERKRAAMQAAMQGKNEGEKVQRNFVITKKGDNPLASAAFERFGNVINARSEMGKSKEQLAEDKKIAMGFRVKPLKIDGLSIEDLKKKANQLWDAIVSLEMEKYDLEERQKRQDYDLKELGERQRQINRNKALKRGLDADALSEKFPPMIRTASKYERRLDRRSFGEKKGLYEGGYESQIMQFINEEWQKRMGTYKEKGHKDLPQWDPQNPKNKEVFEPGARTYDDEGLDEDALFEAFIKPPGFEAFEAEAQQQESRPAPAPAPAPAPQRQAAPPPKQEESEEEEEEEEEEEDEEEEEEEE